MDILERFNKRLFQLEAINDLERRWHTIDTNSPYANHSAPRQEIRNNSDHTCNNLENTSLRSIMNQKRTHAKLADMAARSCWCYAKGPIKVTMSYGKFAKGPAFVVKRLVSVH